MFLLSAVSSQAYSAYSQFSPTRPNSWICTPYRWRQEAWVVEQCSQHQQHVLRVALAAAGGAEWPGPPQRSAHLSHHRGHGGGKCRGQASGHGREPRRHGEHPQDGQGGEDEVHAVYALCLLKALVYQSPKTLESVPASDPIPIWFDDKLPSTQIKSTFKSSFACTSPSPESGINNMVRSVKTSEYKLLIACLNVMQIICAHTAVWHHSDAVQMIQGAASYIDGVILSSRHKLHCLDIVKHRTRHWK